MLHNATSQTSSFYGNDVKTAFHLISRVLQYESQQQGFDLAAMKDASFNEVQTLTYDLCCVILLTLFYFFVIAAYSNGSFSMGLGVKLQYYRAGVRFPELV